jgi:sugar transferase EpsL
LKKDSPKKMTMKLTSKRILDLLISVPSFMVIMPMLIFITILVRNRIGSPVIFKQTRPGLNGIPFTIYKFRTMTQQRDNEGRLLQDSERLTKFGRWLRKASLDELPEIFNVIRGEMSLVGPRPLLMQYLKRYTTEQSRRHDVKPGITGWAQINGRNAISWEDKFKLDVWYVDNRSITLDFKILAMTVKSVLYQKGITAKDCETMPEFIPNSEPVAPIQQLDYDCRK